MIVKKMGNTWFRILKLPLIREEKPIDTRSDLAHLPMFSLSSIVKRQIPQTAISDKLVKHHNMLMHREVSSLNFLSICYVISSHALHPQTKMVLLILRRGSLSRTFYSHSSRISNWTTQKERRTCKSLVWLNTERTKLQDHSRKPCVSRNCPFRNHHSAVIFFILSLVYVHFVLNLSSFSSGWR